VPLPRFVFQSLIEDRARLVRRRNVLPVRPVGMLILQSGGGALSCLRLLEFTIEGQTVVVIAVDHRHAVVVADRVVPADRARPSPRV
jgi:hypothetical protein